MAKMKLQFESELMKNQKQAELMAPDVSFDVIQSSAGDAIFFSISTDHIFYATREVPKSNTGWSKINLSSKIVALHPGALVSAKSFALCQNPTTLNFDLALVVSVVKASTILDGASGKPTTEDSDLLYMSLNNSNDKWDTGVTWTEIPFDAKGVDAPKPLKIADVRLMNTTKDQTNIQNYFVDVQRTPFNSLQLLDRYYINPSSTPKWVRHALPLDLRKDSVKSCLGHRKGDSVPGIYTLGAVGGPDEDPNAPKEVGELIYVPQSNPFRPQDPPNPARFKIPGKPNFDYTSITSAADKNGDTNLFLAATDGLYLFTAGNQRDRAEPYLIIRSDATHIDLKGIISLSAATVGSQTVIWGMNAQRDLFYVACEAGKESSRSAWSAPVVVLSKVLHFAFYINVTAESNVVFAHLSSGSLIQLTQDPETTIWNQSSILLPTKDVTKVAEYYSFTTHIVTADNYGVAVKETAVEITTKSRFSAYINNVYYVLTPSMPLKIVSDSIGEITLVQESDTLAATPFNVGYPNTPSVAVNPLANAQAKLSTIKDGDSLGAVEITKEDGKKAPLVSADISKQDKNSAASALSQLSKVSAKLDPSDARLVRRSLPAEESPVCFALVFGKDGITYHEGEAAATAAGVLPASHSRETRSLEASVSSVVDDVAVAIGDLWRMAEAAWDAVSAFAVREVEGVVRFILHIGDIIYHAIIDTVQAVMGAVELVFQKIKVFFKELVAWLGFLFQWDDILRTHRVLKTIIKATGAYAVSSIESLKVTVATTLDGATAVVKEAAGLKPTGQSIGKRVQDESGKDNSHRSPQSNWGSHHFKNGVKDANSVIPAFTVPTQQESLLTKLIDLAKAEGTVLVDAASELKTLISERDSIFALDPVALIQKVLAICTSVVLQSAKNVVLAILDIAEWFIQETIDALDSSWIEFPVISWMYQKITGEKLTILDVLCLVCAIPATISYKLFKGVAPFPQDARLDQLLKAQNLDDIRKYFGEKKPVPTNGTTPAHAVAVRSLESKEVAWDDVLVSIANFVAMPAGLLVGTLQAIFSAMEDQPGPLLQRFGTCCTLLYDFPAYAWLIAGPHDASYPYIMNGICCGLNFGVRSVEWCIGSEQKVKDALPFIDAAVGILWLTADASYFGLLNEKGKADIAAVVSDSLDGLGGIVVMPIKEKTQGVPKVVFTGIFVFVQLAYSIACFTTGGLTLSDD